MTSDNHKLPKTRINRLCFDVLDVIQDCDRQMDGRTDSGKTDIILANATLHCIARLNNISLSSQTDGGDNDSLWFLLDYCNVLLVTRDSTGYTADQCKVLPLILCRTPSRNDIAAIVSNVRYFSTSL